MVLLKQLSLLFSQMPPATHWCSEPSLSHEDYCFVSALYLGESAFIDLTFELEEKLHNEQKWDSPPRSNGDAVFTGLKEQLLPLSLQLRRWTPCAQYRVGNISKCLTFQYLQNSPEKYQLKKIAFENIHRMY